MGIPSILVCAISPQMLTKDDMAIDTLCGYIIPLVSRVCRPGGEL